MFYIYRGTRKQFEHENRCGNISVLLQLNKVKGGSQTTIEENMFLVLEH
jgi:hypothetical protein